jgi:sigma-B regulation protein RsbU (phosphoserine phosphatase)
MFVTCLYGVLDARTHQFSYVSAGHCPPLLYGARGATYLPAGGKALGMFPESMFTASLKPQVVQLQHAEGLLLYTDGLIEAMNAQSNQLGSDAVRRHAAQLAVDGSTQVTDALLGLVDSHRDGHPLSDDLTLLSIRRKAVSALPRQTTPAHSTTGGTPS